MIKQEKTKSLWADAFTRLLKDKVAVMSLVIVCLFSLVAILTSIGWLAADWAQEVGPSYTAPNSQFWFGTDIFGRNVWKKLIQGTEVAMSVGLVASIIAVPIGVILGAIAG